MLLNLVIVSSNSFKLLLSIISKQSVHLYINLQRVQILGQWRKQRRVHLEVSQGAEVSFALDGTNGQLLLVRPRQELLRPYIA
jgi:hypothetical protein